MRERKKERKREGGEKEHELWREKENMLPSMKDRKKSRKNDAYALGG